MILSASLHAEPSPSRFAFDAARAQRSWRNERNVFAAAELGWLAEEARRRLHREAGGAADFHVLRDVHRDGDGFALLAAHPRLVARAETLLDGNVEIVEARIHCGSLARPRLPDDGDAVVVVPLGWRAEAPLGGISYGTQPPPGGDRYEWPLVVVFRSLRDAPPPRLQDDCLWPSAAAVAG